MKTSTTINDVRKKKFMPLSFLSIGDNFLYDGLVFKVIILRSELFAVNLSNGVVRGFMDFEQDLEVELVNLDINVITCLV